MVEFRVEWLNFAEIFLLDRIQVVIAKLVPDPRIAKKPHQEPLPLVTVELSSFTLNINCNSKLGTLGTFPDVGLYLGMAGH